MLSKFFNLYFTVFLKKNRFFLTYLLVLLVLIKITNTDDILFDYFVYFLNYFNTQPCFFYFGILFFLTTTLSFLFLNYLGLYGVFILNGISLSLFWLSLILYLPLVFEQQKIVKITLGKWIYLNPNYKIDFSFLIDSLSFSFMLLTITIAFFVYFYAFSYFRTEPLVERFLLLLNSFVISMVFLVTSSNLIMLFLGWELIGLTSFFLISFWVARVSTLKAGFKAYAFNKFSDVFLFFFILIIYNLLNDLDILTINTTIHLYTHFFINFFFFKLFLIEFLSIFLVLCAFIKSAQLGPHIWLPDSMEAPVPASALIHSATLVSAGIFLMLRFNTLVDLSVFVSTVLPVVGSLTAAFGGVFAAFTSDIKRILAYSTISHCGFLMVMCSLGINEFTIIYLYIHGFFKAAVFLCVGNVIRFGKNYQDFRYMGGFFKYLPSDALLCFICLFNLAGLPFGLGFYTKHFLFIHLQANYFLYFFVQFNCLIGACMGLFYSYRLYFNVFFDFKKAKKYVYFNTNRLQLNSLYYSNTSLASNISITAMVFVSYVLSIYYLNNITQLNSNCVDYNNSIFFTNFNNFLLTSYNFFFNLSFFNYLVLFIIIVITHYQHRLIFNSYNIYLSFFFSLIFIVFFFVNINLI